jgi:hypothetical protein
MDVVNPMYPNPKYAPIPQWCVISGMGRSKTYEYLGAGKLHAIKLGKRLLIDVEHGLSYLATMPAARIRLSPRRRDALALAEIADVRKGENADARARGARARRSDDHKTP